jgi:hypothetical protein
MIPVARSILFQEEKLQPANRRGCSFFSAIIEFAFQRSLVQIYSILL